MKKALVIIGALLILFSLSGCPGGSKGGLVVWSFTDELENMINNYYVKAFPDVKINYSLTPSDQFENKLDPVLQSGR